MVTLRRLFRRGSRGAAQPASPVVAQTEAEQDAARKYWKAEVAADRQRRGKPDKRPS